MEEMTRNATDGPLTSITQLDLTRNKFTDVGVIFSTPLSDKLTLRNNLSCTPTGRCAPPVHAKQTFWQPANLTE